MLYICIFDCLEYFANEVILKIFQRSVKKKKQNENEKNFWNNLALTSCLSDTIWLSSQFFQHFFSTLYLSVISNLISFFSFFFSFFSFHLTIAQISPDSVEFFHVISYRLWNSNYFFFGNPVPLKITKAYIRLILKFVNGIIFRAFRFSRITKIRTIRAELMETFNKKTSEIRGEESGIKVWKKGSKGHGERGSDVAMLMDTDRVTCAYILERNFSRAERVSSAKI